MILLCKGWKEGCTLPSPASEEGETEGPAEYKAANDITNLVYGKGLTMVTVSSPTLVPYHSTRPHAELIKKMSLSNLLSAIRLMPTNSC